LLCLSSKEKETYYLESINYKKFPPPFFRGLLVFTHFKRERKKNERLEKPVQRKKRMGNSNETLSECVSVSPLLYASSPSSPSLYPMPLHSPPVFPPYVSQLSQLPQGSPVSQVSQVSQVMPQISGPLYYPTTPASKFPLSVTQYMILSIVITCITMIILWKKAPDCMQKPVSGVLEQGKPSFGKVLLAGMGVFTLLMIVSPHENFLS
jgi:hypothetical protein